MALARLARGSLFSTRSPLVRGSSVFSQAFGSETKLQPGEIGEVSGIPEEHLQRKCFIYSPAKAATQQGGSKVGRWKIRFDNNQRWENPLMGWTSTADPLSHVGDSALYFEDKESAMDFAARHGWKFEVQEPKKPVKVPKAYADNFKWKGVPEADK